MGIVIMGAVFVDIKGYPDGNYIPAGRNAGRVEQIYGGVSRNVTEDIANCELRPTFLSLVDDTGTGLDVIRKLQNHKVDTRYVRQVPDGMGTWLAVFDNEGDVVASISKRPNLMPILDILEKYGVRQCFYGHLHGGSHKLALEGQWDGIFYRLLSADYVNFQPQPVIK